VELYRLYFYLQLFGSFMFSFFLVFVVLLSLHHPDLIYLYRVVHPIGLASCAIWQQGSSFNSRVIESTTRRVWVLTPQAIITLLPQPVRLFCCLLAEYDRFFSFSFSRLHDHPLKQSILHDGYVSLIVPFLVEYSIFFSFHRYCWDFAMHCVLSLRARYLLRHGSRMGLFVVRLSFFLLSVLPSFSFFIHSFCSFLSPVGYGLRDCSAEINECESNPCRSGSTCVDALNSFSCTCAPGWLIFLLCVVVLFSFAYW
jgi:hypothetical protein